MSKQYPAKARRWKSCARWSHSLGIQDDLSTDEHDTKEQAEAVCVRIQREGLGGERCHFPLECWVEPFIILPVCSVVVKTAPSVPKLTIAQNFRGDYYVSGWTGLCEWARKNDPTWRRVSCELADKGMIDVDVARFIATALLYEKYGQLNSFEKEEHKMTAPGNTPAVDGSPGVTH